MSSELDRPKASRPFGFLIAGTLIGAALGFVASRGQEAETRLMQTILGSGLGLMGGLVGELARAGKAAVLDVVIMLAIGLIVLFLCCTPRKEPYRSSLFPGGDKRVLKILEGEPA